VRSRAGVGVGGGEERARLVAVQPDGGGVVRLDRRPDRGRGVGGDQVVLDEVAAKAAQRGEPARRRRGCGAGVEQPTDVEGDVHPARMQHVDVAPARSPVHAARSPA